MQMGQERYGMQTMNQSLFMLTYRKMISAETALIRSPEPDELKQMLANPGAVLKRQIHVSQ
jgi:twitching motility protein PilT